MKRNARIEQQGQGRSVGGQHEILARFERLLAVGAVDGQHSVGVKEQADGGLSLPLLDEEHTFTIDGACPPRPCSRCRPGNWSASADRTGTPRSSARAAAAVPVAIRTRTKYLNEIVRYSRNKPLRTGHHRDDAQAPPSQRTAFSTTCNAGFSL